ncbi:MAG TPA: hypothetical protein PKH79_08390 [Prolixibacteraceae bacterium]|nr:hypothetical protein [Prolixibacteraceae bacterium]
MERYEKYKDSGIEWIGEIPEHWKIVPIKRLVGEENTLFLDGDWIESKDIVFDTDGIRYITTGNIGEGTYKEQGLGYITQDTFDKLNCTEVLPFDLVISRLNPPIGRCCIIPDLGKKIVTSVDNVILRPNKKFNKGFLKYVMSNEKYFEYTSLIARGATMQRISRSLLGDINIPVSFDFNEQSNIATYLDRKTTEIDHIIVNKQKLIALYEEEKQAIINQAVTKGVKTHGVRLKDSGVEWLGEIPEHWEVKKLKYLVTLITEKAIGENSKIGLENIDSKTGKYIETNTEFEGEGIAFIHNDILYGKLRPYLAKVWVAEFEGAAVGDFFVIRMNLNLCSDFMKYRLLSTSFTDVSNGSTFGAKMPRVSWEFMSDLFFAIPSIDEQQSIVSHIEKECARLDAIIEKYNKQIDLLQEYRTTLISEVVTGKIMVPENENK